MRELKLLFERNRAWAERISREDGEFFSALAREQRPRYLWIGCSDSRVPANQVVDTPPGELFVHRNVANLVVHTDFNVLSVLQYAVEVLQVEHVIVCGHYGCGGIVAAMQDVQHGLIDNWLRHIKDVYYRHEPELRAIEDPKRRLDRMTELNLAAQVENVCTTTIVQDAWRRGQPLCIHGWIYGLQDGLLRDVGLCFSSAEQMPSIYRMTR